MKGTYLLLLYLPFDRSIKIGRLGEYFFKKGYYLYVGSALNSVRGRLGRHLRNKKKKFWHIDYLLEYATVISIFVKPSSVKNECKLAETLSFSKIEKFGSSDCSCNSHLFYLDNISQEELYTILKSFEGL